jgi:hypothetical protein
MRTKVRNAPKVHTEITPNPKSESYIGGRTILVYLQIFQKVIEL